MFFLDNLVQRQNERKCCILLEKNKTPLIAAKANPLIHQIQFDVFQGITLL